MRKDLPESEWKFDSCPPEELFDCWSYEYARQCPRIIQEYKAMKPRGQIVLQIHWGLSIALPLGFPNKPYLALKTRTALPLLPSRSSVTTGTEHEIAAGGNLNPFDSSLTIPLRIRFSDVDTRIIKDFAAWLKDARKRHEIRAEKRNGKSERKTYALQLKALGYYRLSAHYGGGQAQIPKHINASKDAHFYQIRALAKRVLTEEFKVDSHPF